MNNPSKAKSNKSSAASPVADSFHSVGGSCTFSDIAWSLTLACHFLEFFHRSFAPQERFVKKGTAMKKI
jgi:hypothetical protein